MLEIARPQPIRWTLQQVADRAAKRPQDYPSFMKSFVDFVCAHTGAVDIARSIAAEPVLLRDAWMNVHLAGIAEFLAQRENVEVPSWALDQRRFLAEPLVCGGARSHAMVMAETPGPMRRRNLFCGRVEMRSIRSGHAGQRAS